jgi:single-strand DNA-binding protein
LSGYQIHIVVGRLGSDPELTNIGAKGTAKCTMSVATSEKRKDQEEKTDWHRIVTWGKTAEICAKYLRKGSEAGFEGKVEYGTYIDKDQIKRYTVQTNAFKMFFIGSKKDQDSWGAPESVPPPPSIAPPPVEEWGPPPSQEPLPPDLDALTEQPPPNTDDLPF